MSALLDARGLTRRYGAVTAASEVAIAVEAGEIHALIGPNGAGKSTVVGLIAGEVRADAGTVRLGGRDLTALPAHVRARHGISRSFQVPAVLADLDVLSNVALGVQARADAGLGLWRRAAGDPRLDGPAMVALGRLGIDHLRDRRPAALAHGERRLVELATALATEPLLLLLDEPMAGLGREESAALAYRLREASAGRAILLVEHDMETVFGLADRITVLVEGRVVASGDPAAIRADPAVQAAYLGGCPS